MEIGRVCKYCHVSAYVAYDNCDPVYKQTFKFEILPGQHNSLVWDKIIKIFKKNGYKVELKSWKEFYLLFYYTYLFFSTERDFNQISNFTSSYLIISEREIKNFWQQNLCFHSAILFEFYLIKNELVFYQQLMLLL